MALRFALLVAIDKQLNSGKILKKSAGGLVLTPDLDLLERTEIVVPDELKLPSTSIRNDASYIGISIKSDDDVAVGYIGAHLDRVVQTYDQALALSAIGNIRCDAYLEILTPEYDGKELSVYSLTKDEVCRFVRDVCGADYAFIFNPKTDAFDWFEIDGDTGGLLNPIFPDYTM